MLAFLLAKRQETPKRFYSLHIVSAVLMLVMSVLSVAMPQTGWLTIANVVIIIASVSFTARKQPCRVSRRSLLSV